ncbi:MAG TPA: hypothetical protein VFS18_02470, partial [Actinomycetota bacterium]|nr:hypothetical protein [Actinomycetota bacterium]
MDMKKLLVGLLTGALSLGLIGAAGAGKPKVVFEDATGDAGNAENGVAVPGADQAGFDLVSGQIARVKKNLEFTVTSAAMPEGGALPEGFRFLWHFSVDGEEYRLTIKSADIGKPDVLAGSGQDRVGRVDTAGHFRLETCAEEALPAVLTLVNCNAVENGYLEGAFNVADKTFTAIVPMSLVGAKPKSIIGGGTT